MGDGELDCLDPIEICLVHGVLPARPTMRCLAERLLQRLRHPVEDRDGGQTQLAACFFEPRASVQIDEREQYEPRIALELGQDPFEMLPAANRRPEVAYDIGILELREGRFGEHFERFAGRI